MKLYIVLPDIHDRPPNKKRISANTYHPALQCAERVAKEYQPSGIVYLGDTTDMESLCHFDFDKRKKMEGRRYQRDIDSLNHLLNRHVTLFPKTREWIYFMGNHEHRAEVYTDYRPETDGIIDLQEQVFRGRGFIVVPYGNVMKIGKAAFMHGFDASTYHAAKMSRIYPKSIYYAHVHDVQMHSFVSPIDSKEVRVAASLGCLCDLNPSWMKNRPNRWVHAFGMMWVRDNGNFQMDIKIVVGGKTVVNGKTI